MSAHPSAGGALAARPRPPHLEGLTSLQEAVVMHGRGPLLVYAGPGAGKTKTIVHRVARLVADGLARPSQILAMTFTVRAAEEMRGRLAKPTLLGEAAASGLTVGTFHSMCAQVLRQHARVFGRTDTFTIYDQQDIGNVIELLLRNPTNAELRNELTAYARDPRREVVRVMSLAKSSLMSPQEYVARSRHPIKEAIAATWEAVAHELLASNAFDFDDLLTHVYSLLHSYPVVLRSYRRRWPWILVDEHQDNNAAQIWLIALLAGADGNITAVSDDDQSIFSWRGAELDGTLKFAEYFPGHATILLEENFRCREEILNAAMQCIAHNSSRVPKLLRAVRGPGGVIDTPVYANEHAEANGITSLIREAIDAGLDPTRIHVIARSGYVTERLQGALTAAGIPYRVLGDLGFFERKEVKDAVAYLELLVNPSDARALRRALGAPRRGLGEKTVNAIVDLAREQNLDLIAACRQAAATGVVRTGQARDALVHFADAITHLRFQLGCGRSVGGTVVDALMIPDGLVGHYKEQVSRAGSDEERDDAQRVLEDLRSLCQAASSYEEQQGQHASLAGFLESVALLDATELTDGVDRRLTISSVHRAKGTEAVLVIFLGCEEGTLPSWRSLEETDSAIEEERRLFYVGTTRARDRIVFSCVRTRAERSKQVSRFLAEARVDRRS